MTARKQTVSFTEPVFASRHGGRGRMITVVFRPELEARPIHIALIAFGGRDWLHDATRRRSFADGQ